MVSDLSPRLKFASTGLQFFLVAVMIYPLVWIFFGALKSQRTLVANPFGPPLPPDSSNLVSLWVDQGFGRTLLNTAIIAVPAVLGLIVLSTLAGWALARTSAPWIRRLFAVFALGMFIPPESLMVSTFRIMSVLGLRDSFLGVILVELSWVPLGIFIMQAHFRTIPLDLLDAARMDGCSELGVFLRICLPLVKPAVFSIGLIYGLFSWNEYLWPLILLQDPDRYTVQLAVLQFTQALNADYGLQLAVLALAVLPPLVTYVVFRRNIQSNLLSGAVKG